MSATKSMGSSPETSHFSYVVRDRAGKLVKGKLEADSSNAVVAKLRSMGYAPIEIKPISSGGMQTEIKLPRLGPKVKAKDLAVFTRQFATMIASGLTLLRALT